MVQDSIKEATSPLNLLDPDRCRVSVVIPSYNHARFLRDAICSVIAQTYHDFEIIVVDDGSTDDTAQVAARYSPSIRYIFQKNAGLSAARNTGIRASTGAYLAFLDADDLWHPDFLARLVPVLDRNPDIGAVYSGSQFVDAHSRVLPQTIVRTVAPNRLHDSLIGGEFFPPCAVLVRKSAFDRVGLFDESLLASEDWDMWLRVSSEFSFDCVSEVLAQYRMHGDNMSRDLERMRASQYQVAEKHFGSPRGDPSAWPKDRQRAFAGIYLWHAWAHYQRRESNLGLEYTSRALTTYPGIAAQLDTFYMLACAEQAPGYLGELESLDLEKNSNRLLSTLSVIFSNPTIPARLRSSRRVAFGMAYFAVGILAYGKRQLGKARFYLAKAVINRPILLLNIQWILTFIKSLLGGRILSVLTQRKHARNFTR